MNYREKLIYYKELINKQLTEYMNFPPSKQDRLYDAMKYSLCAGGKRIRPIIVMEFGLICGGSEQAALPAACAIEMMHTFSLIHDDLPCMDNDDMRRGRPSCHKAYDETTALLAGDALEMYPFEILADSVKYGVTPENALKMIKLLADCAGHKGMIGGQQIDTQFEDGSLNDFELLNLYSLKTSRLLQAAACMGCLSAGANENAVKKAYEYGEKLGLAFQIIDDILDICGEAEIIGKPIGSDEENNKETYVKTVGIGRSREKAKELTEDALRILDCFDGSDFLKMFTTELLNRNK
ncbi:MAG: polyprenyl synthetase family protein [Firmicutes bacterium]|nr:polyprenyl synthetase family protein [[Eubacterium] siraeum]MCM1487383.1 polyprenyl synthetase family protein [Bacillota bacterium]